MESGGSAPSTADISRALRQIPNVGPAIVEDLAGQNPDALYTRLCALDGVRHDLCVLDTFTAIVSFANGEPAQPWWVFSRRRKERASGWRWAAARLPHARRTRR